MSTVDIDFSKQWGMPNSREFRSIWKKVYLALGLKSFVDRRQDILFLFTFEGNIQCAKKGDGDK